MKMLRYVVSGGGLLLAALCFASASTETKFVWADLDDPATQTVSRTANGWINQLHDSLLREVDTLLHNLRPESALTQMHLPTRLLPRGSPGEPRATALKLTGARVRNPANAPDEAELAALAVIQSQLRNGLQPAGLMVQKVAKPDAPLEWRVYRSISVIPKCTLCHGPKDLLQPEVRAALAKLFSEDQAVDYAPFDWRGVIRVSYELPEN